MNASAARRLLLSFDTGELMIGLVGFYFGTALLLSSAWGAAMVPFLYHALARRFDWMPFVWGLLLFTTGSLTLIGVWCNAVRKGHCFSFRSCSMMFNFIAWGGIVEAFSHSGEFMERGIIYTIFCGIALLKYWRLQARRHHQRQMDAAGERRWACE